MYFISTIFTLNIWKPYFLTILLQTFNRFILLPANMSEIIMMSGSSVDCDQMSCSVMHCSGLADQIPQPLCINRVG